MTNALSISRLIAVSVNLSPLAAQGANLSYLMAFGASNVIDVVERYREYNDIADVLADFGSSAPEYLAAVLYFEQAPQPTTLFIARWAKEATAGFVRGAPLTPTEQAIATWTAITTGAFKVTIDGTLRTITALDFHLATNLNSVAATITTGLSTWGTCTWDGTRFVIASATTGASSTVGFLTAPDSGADIGAMLKLTAATASADVAGIVAEQPVDALGVLLDMAGGKFYAVQFADTSLTDQQQETLSSFVEADGNHQYGVTLTDTRVTDASYTSDLASLLKALNPLRTTGTYSSSNAYAVASQFGRALTVDFNANNSTITLMYKQEPGIVAEALTASQASALKGKRCNVFAEYDNDTAIIQYGTQFGPAYFDEIHGLDWLRFRIQNDVYNLLYTSPTKVPQTDAGNHLIANVIESGCLAAVNNGLVAPGQWNSAGFGTLKQGDFLPKGYYIYAPPIASQSQADREARMSVPFQVAVKLAGAVHTVDIAISVNR